MDKMELEIRFENATAANANQWADQLGEFLKNTHSQIETQTRAASDETMSGGEILAVILGSAAITAVAKGVQAWLARNQNVSIEISRDGAVKASGLRGKDALALAELVNVWEWCADWYEAEISERSAEDPSGPATGTYRVLRVGSWSLKDVRCRSANRGSFHPGYRFDYVGFRLARTHQ